MRLVSLLFSDPLLFLVIALPLLYSIIAHEVAHGAAALLFGDDTAKRYGRLTANPLPHIDPVGALMLLIAGFGWAKPVPVNYALMRNSRLAIITVALAGCFVNLLIAFTAMALLQIPAVSSIRDLAVMLSYVANINVLLAAFNLIPIPPLDGSRVLMSFLPARSRIALSRIEPYGFFILVFLLFTGSLSPVVRLLQGFIYSLARIAFGG